MTRHRSAEMDNVAMNRLDRVPFWTVISFLGVPGPLLFAIIFGGTPPQIAATPIIGAFIGFVVAYRMLRERKLRLNASCSEMGAAMKQVSNSRRPADAAEKVVREKANVREGGTDIRGAEPRRGA